MEQAIVDYIQQAQKHGLTDFEIKQNLLNAGWEAAMVEQSFVFAKAAETQADNFNMQQQASPAIKPDLLPRQTPAAIISSSPAISSSSQPQMVTGPAVVSDQNFAPAAGASKKRLPKAALIAIIVAAFLLLGGGAFAYYTYVYNTPQRVWNSFAGSSQPNIYSSAYSLAYNSPPASSTSVSLSLSGTLYNDLTDPKNLKSSNTIKLEAGFGAFNVGVQFGYLVINQIIYIDLSKIVQAQQFLGPQSSGWIKIDPNELKDYEQQQNQPISASCQDLTKSAGSLDPLQALDAAKIILPGTFLAKENLNGIAVYHLKNNFDKQAFITLAENLINKDLGQCGQPELTDQQKTIFTAVVNKMQIKSLETWIGAGDNRLYKMSWDISVPSVSDVTNSALASVGPLGTAQAKSRDAKRVADMREMGSALELYYNDFNGYPAALNGQPQGLTPTYIGLLPQAPEPADGSCTDYYNGYWYSPAGTPKTVNGATVYPSYTLSFCLGNDTGGFKAGIAELTEQGIKDNIACPTTPQNCVNPNPQSSTPDLTSAVNAMKFDADLNFTATYSDYGKSQNLPPPVNPIDILDLIKKFSSNIASSTNTSASGQTSESLGSNDAKRLADMRQLASAMELYFNDKNSYPQSLAQLAPTYIGIIPMAPPVSAGSTCSQQDNTYTYKQINANEYQLNFCLGQATGGYSSGKHELTQAGIK